MIKFDLDQRVGDPFIRRPAFVVGTKFQQVLSPVKPDFPLQKRNLDKEGRLRRKAFKLSGPAARPSRTIAEIEALKTKQQGIKFRLGPGQFGKVRVAKRDAQGNVIKDEEGQIIYELKEFNLSMATLPLQDRLELLQDALLTGIRTPMNNIGILLASIFGSSEDVRNLSAQNLKMLQRVIAGAEVAGGEVEAEGPVVITNPWDTNTFQDIIDGRFITKEMWQQNDADLKTRVRAWILKPGATAFATQLSAETPLFGTSGITIDFSSIDSVMGKGTNVMDLGSRRIFKSLEDAQSEGGERIELEQRVTQQAAKVDEEKESEEEATSDPTAAGASALSSAVSAAQSDPSGQNVLTDLIGAVQQQESTLQSRSGTAPRFRRLDISPSPPESPPTPTIALQDPIKSADAELEAALAAVDPAKERAEAAASAAFRKKRIERESRVKQRALSEGISFAVASRRDSREPDFNQDDVDFGMIIPVGATAAPSNIRQKVPKKGSDGDKKDFTVDTKFVERS